MKTSSPVCEMVVVSVVRDFNLYDRLVAGNRFLKQSAAECIAFDNRTENRPIPVRYNDFLASRPPDESVWYVFCHEDFEFLQPIAEVLDGLDRNTIYGTVGADTSWQIRGNLINCRRDGSSRSLNEVRVMRLCRVSTVDCCCLMVHSSLVSRYHLRFDPELEWDLYAEDFSIYASERYGVETWVVPLLCRHWSYGVAGERFRNRLSYVRGKWRSVRSVYVTTTMVCIGNAVRAYLQQAFKAIGKFFWYRRFVGRDEIKISCLRIGIWRYRVVRQKIRRFSLHV